MNPFAFQFCEFSHSSIPSLNKITMISCLLMKMLEYIFIRITDITLNRTSIGITLITISAISISVFDTLSVIWCWLRFSENCIKHLLVCQTMCYKGFVCFSFFLTHRQDLYAINIWGCVYSECFRTSIIHAQPNEYLNDSCRKVAVGFHYKMYCLWICYLLWQYTYLILYSS